MEGFHYPNEAEIPWGLLIVIYPFITGLVAGAFVVSSLYHVFGVTQLKPVARLSLLTAFAFLLVAPLPLLGHLGRPERALEIFLTPQFTSAMSGFGYIWLSYFIILTAEIWLVFRRDIVEQARHGSGLRRAIHSLLSLGTYDVSERALLVDERVARALATVGIPAACILHGYVGFIFGGIKANPWWSTPLMPIIFLLSAIVSGIALLIVAYVVLSRALGQPIDDDCISSLVSWLFGFLMIDLALEGLELLSMAYETHESWDIVSELVTDRIAVSYFGIQVALGTLLPLAVLGTLNTMRVRGRTLVGAAFVSAALVLVGVFAMRWNVIIGGQLISKSLRGFLTYVPVIWGREGVLASLALLLMPVGILAAILYLMRPWEEVASRPAVVPPEPLPAPQAAAVTARSLTFGRRPARRPAAVRRTWNPGRHRGDLRGRPDKLSPGP